VSATTGKTPAQKLRALQVDARIKDFQGWCQRNGLPVPEPEGRFHPTRRWRFDWFWLGDRVALEVEGGVWTHGRHSRGAGMLADMLKYNEAAALGWKVLRTTPQTLKSRETLTLLRRVLT
jgi:hypothetical protein